ncbi:MAG: DUF167 domain-containing protein [Thermodesulfobacteriota bacterium]
MSNTDSYTFIHNEKNGISVNLYIQPKSSKNQISGIYNNACKIKIKAPPVDGAANKECIKYVSKLLNLPKSSVSIISGHTGKNKKIYIEKHKDQTVIDLREKFLKLIK